MEAPALKFPAGGCSLHLADLDLSQGGQELTRPLQEVKENTNGQQSSLSTLHNSQRDQKLAWPLEEVKEYKNWEKISLNELNKRLHKIMEMNTQCLEDDDSSGSEAETRSII
jgi:hypothetical protein